MKYTALIVLTVCSSCGYTPSEFLSEGQYEQAQRYGGLDTKIALGVLSLFVNGRKVRENAIKFLTPTEFQERVASSNTRPVSVTIEDKSGKRRKIPDTYCRFDLDTGENFCSEAGLLT